MRCSFCGETIPKGKGKMFVKNTGQIFYFCNSKCERNAKLGRQGKNIKWTETARKLREKK